METVAALTNTIILALGSYTVLSAGRIVQIPSTGARIRKAINLPLFGLRRAAIGN